MSPTNILSAYLVAQVNPGFLELFLQFFTRHAELRVGQELKQLHRRWARGWINSCIFIV